MSFKKYSALMFVILILTFSGCSTSLNEPQVQTIGVFMPCDMSGRWQNDAEEIEAILLDEGYEAKVFYADKDAKKQQQQIDEMIEYGVAAMIVCPVDDKNLAGSLDTAKSMGIRIIAYEKIISNTDAVDYLACFDNYLIGVLQAESLIEGMQAHSTPPYNIEIFIGLASDTTAELYYEGSMSVLTPLIESGEIVVVSNQISLNEVYVQNSTVSASILRLHTLILEHYSDDTPLHGILSPNDKLTNGFIEVIENSIPNKTYPIITGQNADLSNIHAILDSKQHSTVYKDAEILAQVACSMTVAALNDEMPELNDTETFYNGVKIVPAFLCEPILITKENVESVLIDTEHYSYEEVFIEK